MNILILIALALATVALVVVNRAVIRRASERAVKAEQERLKSWARDQPMAAYDWLHS